jgi:hypothetical protein
VRGFIVTKRTDWLTESESHAWRSLTGIKSRIARFGEGHETLSWAQL